MVKILRVTALKGKVFQKPYEVSFKVIARAAMYFRGQLMVMGQYIHFWNP